MSVRLIHSSLHSLTPKLLACAVKPNNTSKIFENFQRSFSLLGLKQKPILLKENSPSSPKIVDKTTAHAKDIVTSSKRGAVIIENLQKTVEAKFPIHPFTSKISSSNSKNVMGKYFAMSQAFPYIQAGAYKDLVLRAIGKSRSISESIEKTFVIGAFLCWDETGSQYLLQQNGIKALPNILDTRTHFHANLLKKDLEQIFGDKIPPNYCKDTQEYLKELLKKLGAQSKLERSAMMVAFEMHAERMIQELWKSLSEAHELKKETLTYFEAHVGGDDPAEAYHVALTQRLVQDLISEKDMESFVSHFINAYRLNIDWCEKICE
jgi:hypothetical protein